jgi:hypothetical protein
VVPLQSTLFMHTRSAYSGGVWVGKNPSALLMHADPYINTFLEPPKKMKNNPRTGYLKTLKKNEGVAAADLDAELGLNFTVASNWRHAGKNGVMGSRPPSYVSAGSRAEAALRHPSGALTERSAPLLTHARSELTSK